MGGAAGNGGGAGSGGLASNATSPLGTNLAGVKDWSTEWTFVDAFRASRSWISGSQGTWDDGKPVATDADGWVTSLAPGQIVRTLMFWEGEHYPAGQYVVLYEGNGTLEYGVAAARDAGQSKQGRDVLTVDPAKGGIVLTITTTDSSNPLRNIRVIMPGGVCENDGFRYCEVATDCEDSAACTGFESAYDKVVFHPKFLQSIRSYRLLRFMDWGETNDSEQAAWADRPKPSDARWTEKGVPVEVMVDLANRVSADPWFTIPHKADDAYVTEYAKLVKAGLAAGLKAWVEHSNEVWNGQFQQSKDASTRGQALGLSSNPFEAQLRYHSRRSTEIFDIWSQAIGDPNRLVRVMAAQAANAWTSKTVLEFEDAQKKTDVLAIAPYFGGSFGIPANQSTVEKMSVDQLLSELEATALPDAITWMNEQADVAKTHGVALVAYEGGQHLAGALGVENNDAINTLFDAANRDARMGTLYAKYLAAWKAAGGTLFAHFVHCERQSKWGRWGALEYLEQPRQEAPKFDALQTFIETTPKWW